MCCKILKKCGIEYHIEYKDTFCWYYCYNVIYYMLLTRNLLISYIFHYGQIGQYEKDIEHAAVDVNTSNDEMRHFRPGIGNRVNHVMLDRCQ